MKKPKAVRPFSYSELISSINRLYSKILLSDTRIDYVVGILKGGLVPAVHFAHLFNKPMLSIDPKDFILPNEGSILLVDEISDTGATFERVLDKTLNHVTTVAIHYRYSTRYIPNFYDIRIDNEDWILYPWENNTVE